MIEKIYSLSEFGKILDKNSGKRSKPKIISQISVATDSLKPINEDHCDNLVNEQAGFKAIIIADGIGSLPGADQASKTVVDVVKQDLCKIKNLDRIDFTKIFLNAQYILSTKDPAYGKQENSVDTESLGTTLICALETSEKFICAYVGNGSIWHIRGNFREVDSKIRPIPWNAINYLNPHSIMEKGKEALTRYISNSPLPIEKRKKLAIPTVVSIQKDNYQGDCIIITTDGIYSQDQLQFGTNEDRDLLFISPQSLTILFKQFTDLIIEGNDHEFQSADLKLFLKNYLNTLKGRKLLNDDATIGIILTDQMIRYNLEIK